MGKSNKVKVELRDAVDMVDLIQTLKDIADNKFYTLIGQKYKFRRFGESFAEFFRLISLTKATHPLLSNANESVGIVVITIEGSFLGEFNSKIIRKALEEKEKHKNVRFIAVGGKSVDRLRQHTPDIKVFGPMDESRMSSLYSMAVEVKNYLVDEIANNRLGKIIVCYSWPKSFDNIRPRSLKLLPCDELISKQNEQVTVIEKVIEESSPREVIGYLAHLWVTTRLYEIFMDTFIASASAQANFLEDSVDKMKKERNKTKVRYRKARKGDIDKSLRETFSARMLTVK
jgi:ATP synthase F1 gamma subunit